MSKNKKPAFTLIEGKTQKEEQFQTLSGPVTNKQGTLLTEYDQAVVPLSDVNLQIKTIREFAMLAFEHYETIGLGGNQVLLRFKR